MVDGSNKAQFVLDTLMGLLLSSFSIYVFFVSGSISMTLLVVCSFFAAVYFISLVSELIGIPKKHALVFQIISWVVYFWFLIQKLSH